eukprot:12842274-Alexandrium_andersonii.AAC.1
MERENPRRGRPARPLGREPWGLADREDAGREPARSETSQVRHQRPQALPARLPRLQTGGWEQPGRGLLP